MLWGVQPGPSPKAEGGRAGTHHVPVLVGGVEAVDFPREELPGVLEGRLGRGDDLDGDLRGDAGGGLGNGLFPRPGISPPSPRAPRPCQSAEPNARPDLPPRCPHHGVPLAAQVGGQLAVVPDLVGQRVGQVHLGEGAGTDLLGGEQVAVLLALPGLLQERLPVRLVPRRALHGAASACARTGKGSRRGARDGRGDSAMPTRTRAQARTSGPRRGEQAAAGAPLEARGPGRRGPLLLCGRRSLRSDGRVPPPRSGTRRRAEQGPGPTIALPVRAGLGVVFGARPPQLLLLPRFPPRHEGGAPGGSPPPPCSTLERRALFPHPVPAPKREGVQASLAGGAAPSQRHLSAPLDLGFPLDKPWQGLGVCTGGFARPILPQGEIRKSNPPPGASAWGCRLAGRRRTIARVGLLPPLLRGASSPFLRLQAPDTRCKPGAAVVGAGTRLCPGHGPGPFEAPASGEDPGLRPPSPEGSCLLLPCTH